MLPLKAKALIIIFSLAFLFLLAACGASVSANHANNYIAAPGVVNADKFIPTIPLATNYSGPTNINAACSQNAVVQAVLQNKVHAKLDEQLCQVAMTLTGWDNNQGKPPPIITDNLNRYFGIPETSLQVFTNTMELIEPQQIARRVSDSINDIASEMDFAHFGLATIPIGTKQTAVVLVMLNRRLLLKPFPRDLALKTKAILQGQIAFTPNVKERQVLVTKLVDTKTNAANKTAIGEQQIVVLISDVQGKLTRVSAPVDTPFDAEVICSDKPGDIIVQFLLEQKDTEKTIATMPIACGKNLPTSFLLPEPLKNKLSINEVEIELWKSLQQERTLVGLPKLKNDNNISAIAQKVLEQKFIKQTNGQTNNKVDVITKLRSVGIISNLVFQNSTQANTIAAVKESLLLNPIQRSNILNSEITHAGIAVAFSEPADKKPLEIFVVELLVKQKGVIDLEALSLKLLAAIEQKREQAKVGKLNVDVVLTEVAQQYAQELARRQGQVPKTEIDAILAPLAYGLRDVAVLWGARSKPLSYADDKQIISAANAIGIAMAQGKHIKLGPNTVYVVIVLGTRVGKLAR
ncbi:MAG: hypothetical protein JW841_15020 [Deltaproteobacteria bacterium]|nr:hypothetical protein [Deltaproteobacteria bacterium]